MLTIFIIFFVILLFVIILKSLCDNNNNEHTTDSFKNKPYLWSYWELKKGYTKPHDYIDLCFQIMKKNGSKYFNVQILDDKTVLNYLPNLRSDLNELPLALKTDYIRVALLHQYGGLWLDADTIMMTDMKDVADKINSGEDYIGFGCNGFPCLITYGRPANWAMGSKKDGILMYRCLRALNDKLDKYFNLPTSERKEFNYYDLGKVTIWQEYDKLIKDNPEYKYHQYPSDVDGTRDKKGNWISPNLILVDDVDIDEDKLMLVMLVNSQFCGKDPKYNWFCKLTIPEILNSKFYVAKMFNKALSYNL